MKSVYYSDVFVIINLVFYGLLSIVPYTKFLRSKCLELPRDFKNSVEYEDVYFSFYNDYQRQNPITKKDGLKNYINKLRLNGYISQKVYNFAYMNIDSINVMELYYRSKMNRSIVQSQQALAYFNNSYRNSLHIQNKNKNQKSHKTSNITKEGLRNSSIYDEQLSNLLRQSIYKQKFGNNLDELNKMLNNKKIFISNNSELSSDKYGQNNNKNNNDNDNNEDLQSEGIVEKNKDYILKQYKYPFLFNISHNIGAMGDLAILNTQQNNDELHKLNDIKEETELNENFETLNNSNENENEIVRDKNYYGVDFDIYSRKSDSSNNNKNKKESINIEMKDLSIKKMKIKKDIIMKWKI